MLSVAEASRYCFIDPMLSPRSGVVPRRVFRYTFLNIHTHPMEEQKIITHGKDELLAKLDDKIAEAMWNDDVEALQLLQGQREDLMQGVRRKIDSLGLAA